jgi:hypothetical protein
MAHTGIMTRSTHRAYQARQSVLAAPLTRTCVDAEQHHEHRHRLVHQVPEDEAFCSAE